MSTLTYDEARVLYKSGKWSCKVPPVYTGGWDTDDWIYWIFGVRRKD